MHKGKRAHTTLERIIFYPSAILICSCPLIVGRAKAAPVHCGLRAGRTLTQEGSSGAIHGTSSSILIGEGRYSPAALNARDQIIFLSPACEMPVCNVGRNFLCAWQKPQMLTSSSDHFRLKHGESSGGAFRRTPNNNASAQCEWPTRPNYVNNVARLKLKTKT